MPKRARAEDPRLIKTRDELQKAAGALIKLLRKERGMTLADLADAIGKVGGKFYWTSPSTLADFEAGIRSIALEDIVMVARALSTKKEHGEVHPLQLTPWIGASSKLLTQQQAADIEIRLLTERVAWREAKIEEAAREYGELIDDSGFRAAIANLAALPQEERRVMQRALDGLRGGAFRRAVVAPAEPAGDIEGIQGLAATRRRNAAGAREAYRAAAATAKKAGHPFRPVDQRATTTKTKGAKKR